MQEKMFSNKKSSQVTRTTKEITKKQCGRCGSVVLKIDNYCACCGKPNNDETIKTENNFKLSIASLLFSILILILILSN